MMKVHVGSIGYNTVEVPHLMSLAGLQGRTGLRVRFHDFSALWEIARSHAATQFVREEECDVLLLVEADVSFDPADALILCDQALKYGLVAAACGTGPRDCCWVDETVVGADVPHDGSVGAEPIPVRWVGAGMFAVHRAALEALARRPDMPLIGGKHFHPFFFPLFVELQGKRVAAGDVQAFCERIRQEGYEVRLNPGVRAHRISESGYEPIDMFVRRLLHREELASTSEPEQQSPNGTPPVEPARPKQSRRKAAPVASGAGR